MPQNTSAAMTLTRPATTTAPTTPILLSQSPSLLKLLKEKTHQEILKTIRQCFVIPWNVHCVGWCGGLGVSGNTSVQPRRISLVQVQPAPGVKPEVCNRGGAWLCPGPESPPQDQADAFSTTLRSPILCHSVLPNWQIAWWSNRRRAAARPRCEAASCKWKPQIGRGSDSFEAFAIQTLLTFASGLKVWTSGIIVLVLAASTASCFHVKLKHHWTDGNCNKTYAL